MEKAQAEYFMMEAFKAAQNSTCARRRVGAVIVDAHNHIISTGWNHSTNGISCEAKFFEDYTRRLGVYTDAVENWIQLLKEDPVSAHAQEFSLPQNIGTLWQDFLGYTKTEEFKKEHWDFMDQEMHSEIHAIINGYKHGWELSGATIFSSRSPCIDCAKAIIEAGIKKVYYTETSLKGLSGGLALLDQVITIEHLELDTSYYT